ncbi:MAG TPA: hypothetical protein VJ140_07820 [Actinomycetota bacterium]|nr:hypothetical protein [Actinomycetota bacterium]
MSPSPDPADSEDVKHRHVYAIRCEHPDGCAEMTERKAGAPQPLVPEGWFAGPLVWPDGVRRLAFRCPRHHPDRPDPYNVEPPKETT